MFWFPWCENIFLYTPQAYPPLIARCPFAPGRAALAHILRTSIFLDLAKRAEANKTQRMKVFSAETGEVHEIAVDPTTRYDMLALAQL